jgi:hypothetical protein
MIKEKFPNEPDDVIDKLTILAHNSPLSATDETYVNYFVKKIDNPRNSGSNYIENTLKAMEELFVDKKYDNKKKSTKVATDTEKETSRVVKDNLPEEQKEPIIEQQGNEEPGTLEDLKNFGDKRFQELMGKKE